MYMLYLESQMLFSLKTFKWYVAGWQDGWQKIISSWQSIKCIDFKSPSKQVSMFNGVNNMNIIDPFPT